MHAYSVICICRRCALVSVIYVRFRFPTPSRASLYVILFDRPRGVRPNIIYGFRKIYSTPVLTDFCDGYRGIERCRVLQTLSTFCRAGRTYALNMSKTAHTHKHPYTDVIVSRYAHTNINQRRLL